ncbi:FAD/NAD(P)-binding protein [Pseudomonas sp. MMS21-TM103]|uniref:FAD/NAD(P)-binding protein n=1 Tax=Pseudomonas sp. MMS21 TM103 TaxID=2886506 RepID=UPI001EE0C2B0|nr:FAD/NAD(P)-binding protein [Pseudomonas sp. MMS21 TM103]MCG4455916.1 FAD/NAD(P)-binding protein [Pseudomonas sp. MMS21 TM103]
MIDLTPRKLLLLDHYADGEEARHFSLRIDKPAAADRAVIPGQFFMLTVPGFGEAPFTYLKLPDQQGRFDALVRRMGALTQALFEQPPGAVLGYRGPFGKGWPLFFCAHRVLVVAGGCGLAPLAGVIDEASRHRLPLQLSVIYGARNSAAQVLGRERERWRKSLRFMETCDEAKPHQRQGSPLDHFDELFAHEAPEAVLCCGPEALMLATAEACVQRGIAPHKIWLSLERRMHCADGLCGHCYLGTEYVCKDGPTYRYDRYLQVQAAGYRTLITQDQRLC